MAENEVTFRQLNERAKKHFDELKKVAVEYNEPDLLKENNTPLHFYCECVDENCRQRIIIKPGEYDKIHQKRDHFIIVPGHDVEVIERVVRKKPGYWVVEKYNGPPESADKLNPTEVDNI